MNTVTKLFSVGLMSMLIGTSAVHVPEAEARGFSAARSVSVSRSMPRSTPKSYSKPKTTIIKKTEVTKVKQVNNYNTATGAGAGSTFMASLAGSAVGSVAGNAVYDAVTAPDVPEVPTPLQPVEELSSTVEEVKGAVNKICPENFICDFTNKKYYNILTGEVIDNSNK